MGECQPYLRRGDFTGMMRNDLVELCWGRKVCHKEISVGPWTDVELAFERGRRYAVVTRLPPTLTSNRRIGTSGETLIHETWW